MQLSEKVLQDQVIAQLFAGHETTAAIMTRMMQRLKANPHVLARMKQEQDSLIAQHDPQLSGMLCCAVLCCAVPCRAVRGVLCRAVLCHAVSHCAMPCHIVLRFDVLF